MKAIGYIRVSTEEQANSGLGLDAQKLRIEAQASALGYELSEIIEDAGKSGKDLNRPGAQRILELVKTKAADAVIVLKLDRLTRSVRDLGLLLDLFTKSEVALIAVTESLNTSTASGRFMVHLLGSVAQWERETISERTTAALAVKRARGERLGGYAPYGWDDVGGKLVRNEHEQRGIKSMIEAHRAGCSLRQIADKMEYFGYPTKNGKTKWSAQSIKQVIERETRR